MKRIFFTILGGIFLLIVAAVYSMFFDETVKRGGKFYIDYGRFEDLALSHPNGEKLLAHIRENEQLLYDEDEYNDVSAYLSIGFDMRQLGDDNTAISAYKEGLKLDEDNLLGLNNIATSYREIDEFNEAEKAYRKIIELSPGDVMAYRNLADVFVFQYPDDEEGLLEFMNIGIESVLNPSDLFSFLAVYYRGKENTGKAIEYFERFLTINPSNIAAQEEIKRLQGK